MSEALKVRQNYLAIFVAAVVNFLLQAVWYTIFMKSWLSGIGRSREWLMSSGMNEWVQHGTAFVAAFVIAASISCLTQNSGEQTAGRGAMIGAMMWFCFVLPTIGVEYIYELRPLSLFGINCGFWLIGFIVMGLIVGAWKAKAK